MSGVAALSPSCSAVGLLGEQLAIVELMRRGHKVAVPIVDDDGVDLVVNYRLRVQVKSSGLQRVEPKRGYVYYQYAWSQLNRSRGKCDFFLLHALAVDGADRWWVVPAGAMPLRNDLRFTADASKGWGLRLAVYENAWGLLDGDESVSVAGIGGGAAQLAVVG